MKKSRIIQIQKTYLTIIAILSIISLIGVSCSIIFMVKYHNKANALKASTTNSIDVDSLTSSAQLELLTDIKSQLGNGVGVSSLLRSLYPSNIVYYGNDRYVFADIDNSLSKNNFANENFAKSESGEITYSEDSAVVSHKGIDVSKFQGDIDWSKVKNSGVEYAMIRVGYRSYGTGLLTDDSSFKANIEGATSNGIAAGVYFFTQAINTTEAIEEADYVLDKIKDYNVTYPIVLDVEEIVNDTYRQQALTKDELTNLVITFCERIKAAGYTPMIYSNLKGFIGNLDLTRLESYEKWYAYYDDTPYLPYSISMWQYSDSGTVDGISKSVDMNISFKTWN